MQLASPLPRRRARRIGVVFVALLSMGAGFAVWSAQPRQPAASTSSAGADYFADLRLRVDDGAPVSVRLGDRYGAPIRFTHRDDRGARIDVDGTVRPAADGAYDVALAIRRDGTEVAHPRLIVARHVPGTVRVGEAAADGAFRGVELVVDIDRAQAATDKATAEAAHAHAQADADAAKAQADAARAQAEAAREQADAGRQQADAAREQAQAALAQADAGRQQAAASREQSDAARRQAMAAKQAAEAARMQSDADRARAAKEAAEAARQQAGEGSGGRR